MPSNWYPEHPHPPCRYPTATITTTNSLLPFVNLSPPVKRTYVLAFVRTTKGHELPLGVFEDADSAITEFGLSEEICFEFRDFGPFNPVEVEAEFEDDDEEQPC